MENGRTYRDRQRRDFNEVEEIAELPEIEC
jgi:hypothetical protein